MVKFNRASVLKEQGLLLLTGLLETCLAATNMKSIQTEASIIVGMITPNTFISCVLILILTFDPHRLWTQPEHHLIFMDGFISF